MRSKPSPGAVSLSLPAALLAFLLLLLPPLWQTGASRHPGGLAHAQAPAASCPNLPGAPSGPDFSNRDLSGMNFSRRDLRGANFSGATLKGTVFIGANLAGANFSNARVIASDREDLRPTDFTDADLSRACLSSMTFNGRSYFTHADLSCADFSQTSLTSGLAIFGPSPLKMDAASCKTSFRGAAMHCEFVADWPRLELGSVSGQSRTDLSACGRELAGLRLDKADLNQVVLTNAVLDGVSLAGANLGGADLDGASLGCAGSRCANLAGAILDGARLNGAKLDGANLAGASLKGALLQRASLQCAGSQCVDLRQAQLQGAVLSQANLTGANLYGAALTRNGAGLAATLIGAHLKNVNLSFAKLSGANFSGASFYSAYPGKCGTTQPNHAGPTIQCASAYAADITDANFSSAYLYAADFSNARIRGGSFAGAVLVSAEFSAASITSDSNGAGTDFSRAYLQGADLGGASVLDGASFADAYFDFRKPGNALYLNLRAWPHNGFPCPPQGCVPATGSDVCVSLRYEYRAPPASRTITCPDGIQAGGAGCGPPQADGSNSRWKSSLAMNDPAAWYGFAATYTPAAAPSSVCNGHPEQAVAGW